MLLGLCERVHRLVGVDRSAAMLDEAKAKLAAAGLAEPDLREGAMESLPVETASVDVVTCNMALHHATEPAVALGEMRRALRAGGRLVLTDLAGHELEWTRDELADLWPGFPQEELERLIAQAGFEDVRVRAVGACRLARAGSRDETEVDVLLATATAGAASLD
jgi:ArsR family transcriptional regulator